MDNNFGIEDKTAFLIKAGQTNLASFAQIINKDYLVGRFHEYLCSILEKALTQLVKGEKVRLIISVPPRHSKSQTTSIYFPAWALGKFPQLKFILATYGAELAEEMGMKTRDTILSEEYKVMFPHISLKADTKAKANWMVEEKGKPRGSYLALGVGGPATGRGGNCLSGDTKIITEEGIQELAHLYQSRYSGRVLSFNHSSNKVEWKRIVAHKKSKNELYRVTAGVEIKATGEHLFYTLEQGYTPVEKLKGKTLIKDSIETDTVHMVERIHGKSDVYDIEVEDNHNFFANGILVHNCLLIDDPCKSREEAESDVVSENIWDYYRSTLYSRLEGFGAVIVIMQRWNDKDLVGRLLYEEEMRRQAGESTEGWQVIKFPAIAEEDEYLPSGELFRKQGEALWPEKYPLEVLENIKQQQGVYFWNSQYQQEPISRETQKFHDHMFRRFNEEEIREKYLRYYTVVDPAISQKKSADNTVVLTVAKEVNGPNFYRIREDAGHFDPSQTVDLIFQHQAAYHSEVHIETVAYQQALKFAVIEEQRRKQRYFIVEEIKNHANKRLRIEGLIPLYNSGVIYHRPSDIEYERELLTFPNGRRDDRIDCMAMVLGVADNTGSMGYKQFIPKWLKKNVV